MRRALRIGWLLLVAVLVWLLPPLAVKSLGVEDTLRRIAEKSVWKRLLVSWERRSRRRLYRQIDQFFEERCRPVLSRLRKSGFRALGSVKPQTVLEHIEAVKTRFEREARIEGFSEEEITEGVYRIICHELDEVVSRRDRMRTPGLPRRKADRDAFVDDFWYDPTWFPSVAGGVSQQWIDSYNRDRPAVYRFLLEEKGKKFASSVSLYYEAFHVGIDRTSVLCRDNHYAETVEQGIAEGVKVNFFWQEAVAAIASPRIRMQVARAYNEYFRRQAEEPAATN
nr:hypothetical protein [uncultured archaeon]